MIYTYRLFDLTAENFYDDSAYSKSRVQMHRELADIAAAYVSKDQFERLLALKVVEGARNSGNEMTQALKWHTKYHRACGVHVTPTCFLNGIEAAHISSSWTLDQWEEFLTPYLS